MTFTLDKLLTSGLDYETMRSYRVHAGGKSGKLEKLNTSDLSNEELAFCNFCYSITNACHYLKTVDADGTVRAIAHLEDEAIKNNALIMFMNALEREILSWVSQSEDNGQLELNTPNNNLYGAELGGYYLNALDFILLLNGHKRERGSTVDRREDGGEERDLRCTLTHCKPESIKSLLSSINEKVQTAEAE